jgi:pyruvate, orthophosphate dikinase
MVQLGLPVPPGFVIPTAAGRAFLETGELPTDLVSEVDERLAALGDGLVSVRSGAPVSMPGMMDTLLNVGLTEEQVGDDPFLLSCWERLLHGFATTVRGVSAGAVEEHLLDLPSGAGARERCDVLLGLAGRPFPDRRGQVLAAIEAVFRSWGSPRAKAYRRHKGIPDDLGTAVVVQRMVFGNRGEDSGSGVCFTRDPATGAPGAYGDVLFDAQGEDVVAGERDTLPLAQLRDRLPEAADALDGVCRALEADARDLCDIEFTIEHGELFVLQTRVGQRSGRAAVRIAVALEAEGVVTRQEALARVTEEQLAAALAPVLPQAPPPDAVVGRGLACSPGAVVGTVALTCEAAQRRAEAGEPVVLVRPTTSPADLPGVLAAQAVVTARGGRASHAAVVARGLDKPAVCGTGDLDLAEGDTVTVDGDRGLVVRGACELGAGQDDPAIETFLGWRDADRG